MRHALKRTVLMPEIGMLAHSRKTYTMTTSVDGLSTRSVKPMLNAFGKEESSEGGSNLGVNPDW